MERELLLLGLLRSQEMHGYQLNEAIAAHLGSGVRLTKPTAYRLLSRMSQKGWVTFREQSEGNRPPRRVYTITRQGESAFQERLRASLGNYQLLDFTSHIGLAFLDQLPDQEALDLLSSRREQVKDLLESLRQYERHPGSLQLIIDHQACLLAAEQDWLDGLIAQCDGALPREG